MPETMNVQQLKTMRDEYQPHALIDVREKGDFVQKHIFRAVPIPRGQLELLMPERVPVQSIPIIVYCDDGYRTEKAIQLLEDMGYTRVYQLEGGLAAWEAAGYRVDYGTNVPGKDYGEKVAVTKRTPHLQVEEVYASLERGDDLIIVDSRTREEYEISHIPGAYSVPGGELPNRVHTIRATAKDQNKKIVVNCAGRTRSILGADILIRMGIPNVYALENGTAAWKMAGYELANGPGDDLAASNDPEAIRQTSEYAERVASDDGVQYIGIDEFKALLGSDELYYVIDARLPEEYAAGHIPGSTLLSVGQMALQADEILSVNQAQVVFVSDSGVRARLGASMARQLDYQNAFVLDGGIASWIASGGELITENPVTPVYGLEQARRHAPSISTSTLETQLRTKNPPVLIDVRGSGDYALGHIAGSRWIPRGDIERKISEYVPDRDTDIVVICDTGIRSSLTAATLSSMGYSSAGWLDGGLDAWSNSGYELVEGLDGANVSLKVAKEDVAMIGRRGPLARTEQDMIDYLEWEIELGEKYETTS